MTPVTFGLWESEYLNEWMKISIRYDMQVKFQVNDRGYLLSYNSSNQKRVLFNIQFGVPSQLNCWIRMSSIYGKLLNTAHKLKIFIQNEAIKCAITIIHDSLMTHRINIFLFQRVM